MHTFKDWWDAIFLVNQPIYIQAPVLIIAGFLLGQLFLFLHDLWDTWQPAKPNPRPDKGGIVHMEHFPGANFHGTDGGFNRAAISPPFAFQVGDLVLLPQSEIEPSRSWRILELDTTGRSELCRLELYSGLDGTPGVIQCHAPITAMTFVGRPGEFVPGDIVLITNAFSNYREGFPELRGLVRSVDMWGMVKVGWVNEGGTYSEQSIYKGFLVKAPRAEVAKDGEEKVVE